MSIMGRVEAADRRNDVLLRLPDVLRRTGLSRATIYRKADKGEFPAPRRIGANSVAWYESDVAAWIAAPMEWQAAA